MKQTEGKVQMQFNLFTLRRQLEIEKGRTYTWVEIADGSDLSRKTVERMALNQYRRVDLSTLEGLLTFFRREGLPLEIGDLFTVSYPEGADREADSAD